MCNPVRAINPTCSAIHNRFFLDFIVRKYTPKKKSRSVLNDSVNDAKECHIIEKNVGGAGKYISTLE